MDVKERKELESFAIDIRQQILRQMAEIGSGHIGGSLSIADMVAVLYGRELKHHPEDPQWDGRDLLVCSKGHAGPALYAALALRGFFPMDTLDTLNRPGTMLPSHCDRLKTPGIDMTAGSLGQGLSAACGIALALKTNGQRDENRYVYCIVGDGESQEGQIWEAVLFATQQKLSNLILFIDNNKAQLDGYTKDINFMGDYEAKLSAFGWDAVTIDGHDVEAIDDAILKAKEKHLADPDGKPHVIVCDTQKGYGVSFTVPDNCHHTTLSKEQAALGTAELEARRAAL